MNPLPFPEQTAVLAKDQDEYEQLPVFASDEEMISCWRFTWWERLRVLFGGKMWLRQMTFGHRLQPQLPQIEHPFDGQSPIDAG